MIKFNFSLKTLLMSLGILAASPLFAGLALAQTPNSTNEGLSPTELESINKQPIAKGMKSTNPTSGDSKRQASYEITEKGTHIQEFRENGKPVEIKVETSFGTSYEMSTPPNQVPTANNNDGINRVPAVRLPF